jgi:hypothetical protein
MGKTGKRDWGTRDVGTKACGLTDDMQQGHSIIVGATEVVATVGADEFAVMAGEAMAAGGQIWQWWSTCGTPAGEPTCGSSPGEWGPGEYGPGKSMLGDWTPARQTAPLCEISAAELAGKPGFRARGSSGNMPDRLAWRSGGLRFEIDAGAREINRREQRC